MTVYLVTGPVAYREHQPGLTFEADLPVNEEARALARGNVEIIDPSLPAIRPGSWTLPDGWPETRNRKELV